MGISRNGSVLLLHSKGGGSIPPIPTKITIMDEAMIRQIQEWADLGQVITPTEEIENK
jgi:hypothetical protein